MQSLAYSPQFLKHRRFLLVLPVIILPFLSLLFIILGGGKAMSASLSGHGATGLNVRLPDAHLPKGSEKSKLSLYEEASRDSAILREKIKNDPYYALEAHDSSDIVPSRPDETDSHSSRIMTQLAQLKSVIRRKEQDTKNISELAGSPSSSSYSRFSENNPPKIETPKNHNPDIDQLNTLLDKVMVIQHPEMIRDSISGTDRSRNEAYHLDPDPASEEVETFGSREMNGPPSGGNNRFYNLSNDPRLQDLAGKGVEAIIAETQVLVSGSTAKLRLLDDIRIHGHLISKGQFIYGITSLNNERLKIQFSSVRSGNDILPVSLEAYDLDGLAGIYIPGSIERDVAKQSGDQAIGAIALTSLDPSIGAQAAGAGIQAAKSLLSRKIKLIKVTVRSGYKVLLKDTKQ